MATQRRILKLLLFHGCLSLILFCDRAASLGAYIGATAIMVFDVGRGNKCFAALAARRTCLLPCI